MKAALVALTLLSASAAVAAPAPKPSDVDVTKVGCRVFDETADKTYEAKACVLTTAMDGKGDEVRQTLAVQGKTFALVQVRRSGEWIRGTIDGRPSTSYELNRGHKTMTTDDLKLSIEYWEDGYEHGTY